MYAAILSSCKVAWGQAYAALGGGSSTTDFFRQYFGTRPDAQSGKGPECLHFSMNEANVPSLTAEEVRESVAAMKRKKGPRP